jgi:hypothetical protein
LTEDSFSGWNAAPEKKLGEDFRRVGKIVLVCRLFLLMDIFLGSSQTADRPAV